MLRFYIIKQDPLRNAIFIKCLNLVFIYKNHEILRYVTFLNTNSQTFRKNQDNSTPTLVLTNIDTSLPSSPQLTAFSGLRRRQLLNAFTAASRKSVKSRTHVRRGPPPLPVRRGACPVIFGLPPPIFPLHFRCMDTNAQVAGELTRYPLPGPPQHIPVPLGGVSLHTSPPWT